MIPHQPSDKHVYENKKPPEKSENDYENFDDAKTDLNTSNQENGKTKSKKSPMDIADEG